MTELDNLRPEVREAIGNLYMDGRLDLPSLDIVQDELLRLAGENRELRSLNDTILCTEQAASERADKAEAELAALRARIAKSPTREVFKYFDPHDLDADVRHLIGKRVRLLVDEPPAERGEG